MDESIHIKPELLREHAALVQRERRLAQLLIDQFLYAYQLSGGDSPQLRRMAGQADRLARYFGELSDLLDDSGIRFTEAIQQISLMLQDRLSETSWIPDY